MCPEVSPTSTGVLLRMCSTPYGIKGVSRACSVVVSLFLLACSTPYGIKGVSSEVRGIWVNGSCVLNALRHQRCVQSVSPPGKHISSVLNALRHQRCVQVHASPIFSSGNYVLNALRHQRCVQGPLSPDLKGGLSCSTPYGIKGVSRVD